MPIVWIALPFILAFACYGEIRERRIPNWLTLGGIAFGVGAAAIEGGADGLVDSALGLAIAGGLFLPFCLLGVVGGGDMKLMAAVGAIVGWPMVLRVVCNTCIAGGLVYWLMMIAGFNEIVQGSACAVTVIAVRLLAVHYGWSIPMLRNFPDDNDGGQ